MRIIKSALLTIALVLSAAASASAHDGSHEQVSGRHQQLSPAAMFTMFYLRISLDRFRDPQAAVKAGWVPTDTCTALPDGSAGMGFHYINPARINAAPDPLRPAIPVYVPTKKGGRTLGAAEWFAPDADQDLSTDNDRPSILGLPFDGPMPGHEAGMPVHYDLHAWLFKHNPDGLLTPFNPNVHC